MFKPVDPKVDFPKLESEVLAYWKENNIFEKSVANRPQDKRWTFLDGPPFVTGMPHYGSLLSSLAKDLFGRYWTMKGYRVRRVWGWDGHGLPIENKVENELEVRRKRDIEEVVGVKRFVDACKQYVNVISGDWQWYVDKIGRWADFKNAYKTWDKDYMESVMWVFKQMYDKNHIYKGLRVSLYCPHCSTPVSNFEIAMDADNHKEVPDAATTYKYELKLEARSSKLEKSSEIPEQVGDDNRSGKTYILAWSTTPWNKIVTPALAVNPNLTYVKVKQGEEYYILAKTTLKILKGSSRHAELDSASRKNAGSQIKSGMTNKKDSSPLAQNDDSYEIVEEFKGAKLIGQKFIPHYDYYKIKPGEKAFEIIGGDFVTADEGTGVVTIAAYGEEDLKAMQEENIHIEMHLDEEGIIKPDVPLFGGMYYLKANKVVNEDLAKRNLIYKDETVAHVVPLCWRCHTRLYFAPIDAWFVNVQELKPLLIKTNEEIHWYPKHFKHGRFLKSLENAPDWNISRNRYWGSPVPVWECECGERFVPGSIAELEEASGQKIIELHKPEIDEVRVTCKKCGKKAHRVPEVLDSWIEAGSASFAERHFPFNTSEKLEDFFPPDFIVEYTGQIRAWFYVLHVIGGAIYGTKSFKNVGVTGVILGSDGKKMSKNLKNYPDPREMLDKFGGDALRLYLLGSAVMKGEDILISEEQYRNQVRGTMLILWNVYNFFLTYAGVDGWKPVASRKSLVVSKNILDEWILSLLNQLILDVTKSLDSYNSITAIDAIKFFVDEFSTWYIRRSRDRVGPSADDESDKQAFYETTYHVLVTISQLIAPIIPFLAESMYRNLTGEESVHLTDWPNSKLESGSSNLELISSMNHVRRLVEQVHSFRKSREVKVRQPLKRLGIFGDLIKEEEYWKKFESIIKDELNIKIIEYLNYEDIPKGENIVDGTVEGTWKRESKFFVDFEITPELKAEGEMRDIVRKIQEERKKLGTTMQELVNVSVPDFPKEFENEIKKKALVENLTKGEFEVKRI